MSSSSALLAVIVVAGGKGKRMGSALPKQYHLLAGKPMIQYSLDVFVSLPFVSEIIVVSDPAHRHRFSAPALRFAEPGHERQESVFHGFSALTSTASYVCIHDAARPFIDRDLVRTVFTDAKRVGAACAACALPFTIKHALQDRYVLTTPCRDEYWEIQTPQIIRRDWLQEGIAACQRDQLHVTDDVSLVEHLGYPVYLSQGKEGNRKITHPDSNV